VSQPDQRFVAVVLAAQRAGTVDPLATAHGLTHKCLVPIEGSPLIAHVVVALFATPGLHNLRIVVEPEMIVPLRALFPGRKLPLDFVPAADNLADSVFAATRNVDLPIIVTTADNVLLTPGAVSQMVDTLRQGVDVAVAMATKVSVMTAHPEGQRRYYSFSDDDYSNCNLYGLAGSKAAGVAESFRSGGQFAKKPLRLIMAVGILNVVLVSLKRLSLVEALSRLGRRFKLRVEPVILADGAHAVDVDNERTYRVAALLLDRRRFAETRGQHGQVEAVTG
jgi:GTP:adenosylcobinamide-phosphate guanylyltransferase